jgi:MarR family transcriptional regulator, organic hydroperoxide resistance regulator
MSTRQLDRVDAFTATWERFFRTVRRARARAPERGAGELTLAQYLLLAPLAERSPQAVGELADAAGIAGPTATRLLDSLAAADVVARRPSERDRRSVDVSLTAKGARMLARTQEWVEARRRRIYDALAPDERDDAERLLGRLADIVEALDRES